MRALSGAHGAPAIYPPAQTGSESCAVAVRATSETSTAQSGSEDHSWFSKPARDLLGTDPGFVLHKLTEVPERTSYRYASGERPVPGFVIYRLLRSEHGSQWLAALMDGSDASWWRELCERKACADAYEAKRQSQSSL